MYSAIIIDDEPWTIIDIEQTLPMEELGFRITNSFKDPKTALVHIITQKPDLIITDIRMPNMTGIELMQKIREQNISCEIIIISGYGEFEYAKKAIQFGATGYCLKPLNPKEAYETLKLVKERLDKRNQERNDDADNNTTTEVNIDNFEQMVNYIDTHFSETLTLKSLANKFYLNPNYCCSLFTKFKRTTFSQYLTNIRLTEAKKLLESSSYSLDEISSLVGFHDYFYFSNVFKKYSNLSPKDYRKILKESQK